VDNTYSAFCGNSYFRQEKSIIQKHQIIQMNAKIVNYILFLLLLTIVPQSVAAQRDVRTNIRQGNRAYNQQHFSDAIAFYENALNENPASKEAVFNLGNALYRAGEWERAVEQFGQFLALEQDDPIAASAAWHNIGNAMLRQYELRQSLEAYQMALRLNPRDDETRYNLATVQQMIRDDEEDDGGGDGEDDQEQQQEQQQEQDQQRQQSPEQRVEQLDQPEQMSRENARQILQAIEQDERETQERVQRMREQERERQADENRRLNRNW
jgi:tetratricopeptide (TPR) repeat protein